MSYNPAQVPGPQYHQLPHPQTLQYPMQSGPQVQQQTISMMQYPIMGSIPAQQQQHQQQQPYQTRLAPPPPPPPPPPGPTGIAPMPGVDPTFMSTNTSKLRRGPWSPEEDAKLLELVSLFGGEKNLNWVKISQVLQTRTAKQARERYHQNLKPSLNRTPITPEEGRFIEELVQKYGKKWAEIARHLNGRSDNAIKNWWNGGSNRRKRAMNGSSLDVHGQDPPALNKNPSTESTSSLEDLNTNMKKDDNSDNLASVPPSVSSSTYSNNSDTSSIPSMTSMTNNNNSSNSTAGKSEQQSLFSQQQPQDNNNNIVPTFNTAIFGKADNTQILNPIGPLQQLQQSSFPPPTLPGRSGSVDWRNSTNGGMEFVAIRKRKLADEYPIRRHSAASIHSTTSTYNGNSSANNNYQLQFSTLSGNSSPLSRLSSRNSSIVSTDFTPLTHASEVNSISSRRSSFYASNAMSSVMSSNSAAPEFKSPSFAPRLSFSSSTAHQSLPPLQNLPLLQSSHLPTPLQQAQQFHNINGPLPPPPSIPCPPVPNASSNSLPYKLPSLNMSDDSQRKVSPTGSTLNGLTVEQSPRGTIAKNGEEEDDDEEADKVSIASNKKAKMSLDFIM